MKKSGLLTLLGISAATLFPSCQCALSVYQKNNMDDISISSVVYDLDKDGDLDLLVDIKNETQKFGTLHRIYNKGTEKNTKKVLVYNRLEDAGDSAFPKMFLMVQFDDQPLKKFQYQSGMLKPVD